VKEVSYSGGSFVTTDEVADALLQLDRAMTEADIVGRCELPVPEVKPEVLWVHFTVGGDAHLFAGPAFEPAAEVPLQVTVPVSTIRHTPADIRPISDQLDTFGYDWM